MGIHQHVPNTVLYSCVNGNSQNHNNHLIKNTFQQNQGFVIIGTLHLVLSATTSGKDNSMESLPVIFDTVKEHIWRDFGPFLGISFTFLGLCLSTDFFNSAHRFSIGLRSGDWDGHCRTFRVIVLLESPPMAKSQPSGKGNQIFSQNCLILDGIHYAINPKQCLWTSGI